MVDGQTLDTAIEVLIPAIDSMRKGSLESIGADLTRPAAEALGRIVSKIRGRFAGSEQELRAEIVAIREELLELATMDASIASDLHEIASAHTQQHSASGTNVAGDAVIVHARDIEIGPNGTLGISNG